MPRSWKNRLTLTVAASALLLGIAVTPNFVAAKDDRDTLVRRDREAMRESDLWLYNNLDTGVKAAKKSGKPIVVVFR